MILNRRFLKHATIPDALTHVLEQPSVFQTLGIVILIGGHVYWRGGSTNPFELRNKNEEFCVRPWVILMASGMA